MCGKGLCQQKKTGTRRAAVFLKSVLGQGLLCLVYTSILGENVTATAAKALANGKTVELAAGSMLTVSGANANTALNLDASGTGTMSVGLGLSLIHI